MYNLVYLCYNDTGTHTIWFIGVVMTHTVTYHVQSGLSVITILLLIIYNLVYLCYNDTGTVTCNVQSGVSVFHDTGTHVQSALSVL